MNEEPIIINQAEVPIQKIWQQVCADLELRVSPAVYNFWIVSNPLTHFEIIGETQATATITCPTAFHATNIKKNLQTEIQASLHRVTGKETELLFEVGSPTTQSNIKKTSSFQKPFKDEVESSNSKANQNKQPHRQSSGAINSPRVEDLFSPQTIHQSTISQAEFAIKKAGLRPDYTFTTFAVSTTNEMAHAAASAVSQNPGTAYNPLFFYGGVGVGKTHLMQAIGSNLLFTNPDAKVLYCTGEEFTNEIVSSIQNKKTIQFKTKYRNVGVLLIDDIQFIAGKNAVQEEFFHTFNSVIKQQGQIVMTSDRPPHEINLLEDRLRSRFEAGLMIDIQQPSFELRTAILLIKAKAHYLDVPMDIAQLIASKVDSARKIEGIISSLRSEVELKHKEISKELVTEILNLSNEIQFQNVQKLRVSPTDLIKAVANHFHIKQIEVKGLKRQKSIVHARHIAMYFLKKELDMPYTEIGRWFSNRDHTSAMHACNKIDSQSLANDQLRQELSAIKMSLKAISK